MAGAASHSVPIGLVGCGHWGRLILRDLLKLRCAVTVVEPSAAAAAAAIACGATEAVADPDALSGVEGVVIATPAVTHSDIIATLLGAGVPVFVEKPMTTDVAAARRLAAEAPDRLFVMDKWRYHPGVELLGRIARSGEIGAAIALRTFRLGWGHRHGDVDCVWTLAPHDASIALEVLGRIPPATQASAVAVGRDPVALVGVLRDDVTVVMEVGVTSPTPRREMRLECEGGVAVLADPYSEGVEIWRAHRSGNRIDGHARPEICPIPTEPSPLIRELEAFVGHVRGGPPPRSSAAEGVRVVETVADLRRLAGLDQSRPA